MLKYPKVGTPNPKIKMFVVNLDNEQMELESVIPPNDLPNDDFIYTAVTWISDEELSVIWTNRVQNESRYFYLVMFEIILCRKDLIIFLFTYLITVYQFVRLMVHHGHVNPLLILSNEKDGWMYSNHPNTVKMANLICKFYLSNLVICIILTSKFILKMTSILSQMASLW